MSARDLENLICGNYLEFDSTVDIYNVLANNIVTIKERLDMLIINDDEQEMKVLGPYYLRNILENSCSALLGRLDPFRLIFVHKIQTVGNLSLGTKYKAAINWSTDIYGAEGVRQEDIWKVDKEYPKIEKSLFSVYYGEIYWNRAFKNLLDCEDFKSEESLEKYRTSISDHNKFISYLRSVIQRLYSSLSKGVHSELLIPNDVQFDRITLFDLIDETIELCSFIGLLSHFMDISHMSLNQNTAFNHYKNLNAWRETFNER